MASAGGSTKAKGGRLTYSPPVAIVWKPAANRSRAAQLGFIARDNPEAAARVEEEINRQVAMLAEFPTLGREGRVPGTRELVINRSPFVLVFRVRSERIEIVRLLHGAQMWPRPSIRSQQQKPF